MTTTAANGHRPFAIVTGASSGIGFELARCCAEDGHDLLVVADEPQIEQSAQALRRHGTDVRALQADLSSLEGVERVVAAAAGRPVDTLLANAGRGLGHGFLDQDFAAARHVFDTNVTGTLALVHRVGRDMRERGQGSILITGSIAGYLPGAYQAVYNGTKAFLDSFSYALREELRDSGVKVTCLMPGATETRFFERANLMDTKVGTMKKDDPAEVARQGYAALRSGKSHVVTGLKNKLQVAAAQVLPGTALAHQHTKQAAPGTAYGSPDGSGKTRLVAGAVAGLGLLAAATWMANKGQQPLRRRASQWARRLPLR